VLLSEDFKNYVVRVWYSERTVNAEIVEMKELRIMKDV